MRSSRGKKLFWFIKCFANHLKKTCVRRCVYVFGKMKCVFFRMCMCMCTCLCVRACVRACVHVCMLLVMFSGEGDECGGFFGSVKESLSRCRRLRWVIIILYLPPEGCYLFWRGGGCSNEVFSLFPPPPRSGDRCANQNKAGLCGERLPSLGPPAHVQTRQHKRTHIAFSAFDLFTLFRWGFWNFCVDYFSPHMENSCRSPAKAASRVAVARRFSRFVTILLRFFLFFEI